MYNRFNVVCYIVCKWLIERSPSLANNIIIKLILKNCFQDWVEWKTQDTLVSIDRQTEEIKDKWDALEEQDIVEAAKLEFPDAKVSLITAKPKDPDNGGNSQEGLKGVLIEHPPDGSKAQDLLGGAMEIRAPWTFSQDSNGFKELKRTADGRNQGDKSQGQG